MNVCAPKKAGKARGLKALPVIDLGPINPGAITELFPAARGFSCFLLGSSLSFGFGFSFRLGLGFGLRLGFGFWFSLALGFSLARLLGGTGALAGPFPFIFVRLRERRRINNDNPSTIISWRPGSQ